MCDGSFNSRTPNLTPEPIAAVLFVFSAVGGSRRRSLVGGESLPANE